jgi:hypothetical protein
MRNIPFFGYLKLLTKKRSNSCNDDKIEIQKEQIKNDNVNRNPKLDFHLFDIDTVFAN